MKFRICFAVQSLSFFLLFVPSILKAGDPQVGTHALLITPPLGIPMAGQYFERGAEGVHDDLYARAMVIEKEGVYVAIVSCDLIELTSGLVSRTRTLIEQETGIPPSNVMIGATHSHTGPVVFLEDMYQPEGKAAKLLSVYIEELPSLISESVTQAYNSLEPAKLSAGKGHEESVSFNRRFYMKDGTVGWNPGVLNPEIIQPAGPIDPEVQVLYAESKGGRPLSTYVNFALHLDIVGGLEISADFPYAMSLTLGDFKGEGMLTMFGQGCCGNVNHINVKKPGPQNGHALAAQIGSVVGAEVIKTFSKMDVLDVDRIRTGQEYVMLPLADIEHEPIEEARQIASQFGLPDAPPFMDMVNAYKVLDVDAREGKPIDFEIQAFALGEDYAIVALPGEIFTELGIYIKARSPFPNTMVIELANGNVGYVPNAMAFVEGNYEPVSARCAPGSGELMAGRVLEMLNGLKNGKQ